MSSLATPAQRLLSLALDPTVHVTEDPVAMQILDGALDLAAASGIRHLTMDDVARRARVGRMTVYRRFGAREKLIDALAIRECRRCLARIASAIDPDAPLVARAARLLVATVAVIREHPLLARLARNEPEALLRELNRNDSAVFRMVRDFLVELVRDAQTAQELVSIEPAVLAELGLRLGVSFVLMPESALALHDERAALSMLSELLTPLLTPA